MGISKEVLLIQPEVPDMDLCSEITNTSHMHEQTPSMNEGLATSHIQSPDLDFDAWTTPYGQSMLAPEAAFYSKMPQQRQHTMSPPSRAALALMPRNKRIQQDTTTGLFSWPRECREALYIAVLHPYCGLPQLPRALDSQRKCHFAFNHKKATKLMVLCSQVWEEAIEIIHLIENMLLAAGGKGPIFRHPKDFGKPGFFQTDRRTTRLHIPPILSEGQILRMRKIAIQINYPSHQNWLLRTGAARNKYTDVQRLRIELSAIFNALQKSHCLDQVRIILYRDLEDESWTEDDGHELLIVEHPFMRRLLKPLIDMAHARGIRIGAEQKYRDSYWSEYHGAYIEPEFTEPLVAWFNNAAISPEIRAKFTTLYNEDTDEMREKSLGRCKNSAMPYELTPECRYCLRVFGGWEQLAMHLKNLPKHRMRFRYKKWNELYHLADRRAPRKCPTCAKSYDSLEGLYNHLYDFGHERLTIVPRYVCDNNAYERRAQQQAKRKMDKQLRERMSLEVASSAPGEQ